MTKLSTSRSGWPMRHNYELIFHSPEMRAQNSNISRCHKCALRKTCLHNVHSCGFPKWIESCGYPLGNHFWQVISDEALEERRIKNRNKRLKIKNMDEISVTKDVGASIWLLNSSKYPETTKYCKEKFMGYTHRFVVELYVSDDWRENVSTSIYSDSDSYEKLEEFINKKKSPKVLSFKIVNRSSIEQDEAATRLINELDDF